jgi:myo-inositol-1(or 4)-monophosphatase
MNYLELVQIAQKVALAAGELLLNRPTVLEVSTKSSEVDVVTQMDRASEALITSLLAQLRPADGLLGEEGADVVSKSGVTWVVDPIDGTVNYLYGLPGWNVSIGAQIDGQSVAGVVHAPLLAGGTIWSATRGGGAFSSVNGGKAQKISVNNPIELSHALLATGFSYSRETRREQGAKFAKLIPEVRDIRRFGAAAVDLCFVAQGAVDGFFEIGLKPWDLAAGGLIATEAGATLSNLSGGPADESFTIAAGPHLHVNLLKLLN